MMTSDDDHDYDCWLELYTHKVEIVSPTKNHSQLNSKVCNANIHKSIKGLSIKEVDDNDKTFFILIFFKCTFNQFWLPLSLGIP